MCEKLFGVEKGQFLGHWEIGPLRYNKRHSSVCLTAHGGISPHLPRHNFSSFEEATFLNVNVFLSIVTKYCNKIYSNKKKTATEGISFCQYVLCPQLFMPAGEDDPATKV